MILGHMALAKIKCTPIVIHFSNSIPPIYITASDQSMVESGVTEGGKTLPVFFIVNEHDNTNMKPQAKKQRFSKLFQKRNNS